MTSGTQYRFVNSKKGRFIERHADALSALFHALLAERGTRGAVYEALHQEALDIAEANGEPASHVPIGTTIVEGLMLLGAVTPSKQSNRYPAPPGPIYWTLKSSSNNEGRKSSEVRAAENAALREHQGVLDSIAQMLELTTNGTLPAKNALQTIRSLADAALS